VSELASEPSTPSELASEPSTPSELASEPSTPSERVLVYAREGCHLCEAAEADVARICGELGLGFASVDIDTDPELRAEYGDRVPVIMVDGREHGFWRVEETRLRAALE
jgi:glutaredoxin